MSAASEPAESCVPSVSHEQLEDGVRTITVGGDESASNGEVQADHVDRYIFGPCCTKVRGALRSSRSAISSTFWHGWAGTVWLWYTTVTLFDRFFIFFPVKPTLAEENRLFISMEGSDAAGLAGMMGASRPSSSQGKDDNDDNDDDDDDPFVLRYWREGQGRKEYLPRNGFSANRTFMQLLAGGASLDLLEVRSRVLSASILIHQLVMGALLYSQIFATLVEFMEEWTEDFDTTGIVSAILSTLGTIIAMVIFSIFCVPFCAMNNVRSGPTISVLSLGYYLALSIVFTRYLFAAIEENGFAQTSMLASAFCRWFTILLILFNSILGSLVFTSAMLRPRVTYRENYMAACRVYCLRRMNIIAALVDEREALLQIAAEAASPETFQYALQTIRCQAQVDAELKEAAERADDDASIKNDNPGDMGDNMNAVEILGEGIVVGVMGVAELTAKAAKATVDALGSDKDETPSNTDGKQPEGEKKKKKKKKKKRRRRRFLPATSLDKRRWVSVRSGAMTDALKRAWWPRTEAFAATEAVYETPTLVGVILILSVFITMLIGIGLDEGASALKKYFDDKLANYESSIDNLESFVPTTRLESEMKNSTLELLLGMEELIEGVADPLYISTLVGGFLGLAWTASFIPSFPVGVRATIFELRVGIADGPGMLSTNRESALGPNAGIYVLGAYLSCVLYSWFLSSIVFGLFVLLCTWPPFFEFVWSLKYLYLPSLVMVVFNMFIAGTWFGYYQTTYSGTTRTGVKGATKVTVDTTRPHAWAMVELGIMLAYIPASTLSALMRCVYVLLMALLGLMRVDTSLLPTGVHTFDSPYKSFAAQCLRSSKHRSPLLLVALDIFCAAAGNEGYNRKAARDKLSADSSQNSVAISASEEYDEARRRRLRVRNRFWVAWTLIIFPELRDLRKHALLNPEEAIVREAEREAAAAALAAQAVQEHAEATNEDSEIDIRGDALFRRVGGARSFLGQGASRKTPNSHLNASRSLLRAEEPAAHLQEKKAGETSPDGYDQPKEFVNQQEEHLEQTTRAQREDPNIDGAESHQN